MAASRLGTILSTVVVLCCPCHVQYEGLAPVGRFRREQDRVIAALERHRRRFPHRRIPRADVLRILFNAFFRAPTDSQLLIFSDI